MLWARDGSTRSRRSRAAVSSSRRPAVVAPWRAVAVAGAPLDVARVVPFCVSLLGSAALPDYTELCPYLLLLLLPETACCDPGLLANLQK